MSEHLAVISATSIQDYIFRSNRLREQVGASRNVKDALGQWRERALFVGGGNAVVRFPSLQEAHRQVFEWSRRQLEDAPGLRFSVGFSEVTENAGEYYEAALDNRQACEESPSGGGEPGALPICVTCPSTGLAATTDGEDQQGRPISAEAAKKQQESGRVERLIGGWKFPLDLDKLGTTENASQVAVVHADGNGIGKLVSEALAQGEGGIERLGQLSKELSAIGRRARIQLIDELRTRAEVWHQEEQLKLKPLEKGGFYMPIRLIVDGGDDATWVCAGKIGLATAARYLQIFEQVAREAGKEQLTACAGVAIVPRGYPFSRAYSLAANLCGSAKRKSREESGLDFQVVLGGSTQGLEDLRSDTSVYKRHSARPYRLGEEWNALEAAIIYFQQEWPRSRAKSLLQAFGRNSPGDEIAIHEHRNYKLPRSASQEQVFDALEVFDFHLPWATPASAR